MFCSRLYACLVLLCLFLPLTSVGQVSVDSLLDAGAFERAARVLEDRGDRASLMKAAQAWRSAGKFDLSKAATERVISGPDGAYPIDSLVALAIINLGNLRYEVYDDEGAAGYYERALHIRDSLPGTSANDRGHIRTNLAAVKRYLKQFKTSGPLIRESLELLESDPHPDTIALINALNELGVLAIDMQDFTIGRSSSRRATALAAAKKDLDLGLDYRTHYRAARILLRLNELSQSLTYAKRALEVAERLGDAYALADAHNMVGLVEIELGDTEAGRQSFLRGVEAARGEKGTASPLGHLYLNLAEYYGNQRNLAEFDKYRRMAREQFTIANRLGAFYQSDRIPGFLVDWGREQEAIASLNERLSFLTGIPADRLYEVTEEGLDTFDLMPLIDLLGVRGRAYAGLDSTDRALRDYRTVFRMLEHLRNDVSTSASRGHLSKNLRPFYDQAIRLYYRRYRATNDAGDLRTALALSEQSRAYSLLTAMHTNRSDASGEERQLTARIADLERRVSLGEETQQPELERSRLQLDRLRSRRDQQNTSVGELSPDSLLAYLRKTDCYLVEYLLSPAESLVFVLSPGGELEAYPIPAADSLAARVERFRNSILKGYYRGKSLRSEEEQVALDRQYLAAGTELVNQLLPAPLRKALHPRPRLCIVPDGVLNYLPFAALPLAGGDLPLDYAGVSYLQDSCQLHYAYSGRYLMEVGKEENRAYEQDLLAFAPSFGKEGEAVERRAANQLLRGSNTLGQLPFNRPEVEGILDLLGNATAYFGEQADRQHFIDGLGSSRILHLSSHGSVHPTDPNLSFVAFSQIGDSIDREEMLYFNDLYALPIDNELTVLSACETSLGELALGETTMSLASAFAAAGSRSTLTTLWEVDDRATKNLMVEFYRRLVGGDSRSDALLAAQSDLREGSDYAHPYFWSAMTLYGASGPIMVEARQDEGFMPAWSYVLSASLVVAILAYFLLILKRSTNTTIG